MANSSKYMVAGIAGLVIWELLPLVLGNQPNTAFVRQLMMGERP